MSKELDALKKSIENIAKVITIPKLKPLPGKTTEPVRKQPQVNR
ncbi:unnamed protein product [marine sediment metagenome]|uniref:Uncharacterized protein n=1 Tax=marine sediment metagenome TaxID=412755 RepID=X1E810_9ZZZZ